jgi:SAM-dependent methyltransferase
MNDEAPTPRPFRAPSAYECGRPDYPPAAIAWLTDIAGIGAGTVVVDVGAGTGKLSGTLPRQARILAIEPDGAMRAVLHQRHPHLTVLAAAAEALPLQSGSVDVVAAAQALHLFRPAVAGQEFRRVLRPSGLCIHVWKRRIHDEVHDRIAELVEPLRDAMPSLGAGLASWRSQETFRSIASERFPHSVHLSRVELLRRSMSTPYVVAAAPERLVGLERRLRAVIADLPEPVRLDYHTEVYVEAPRAAPRPPDNQPGEPLWTAH